MTTRLLTAILALAPHVHDPILPGPAELWNSCCGNNDCREARIAVSPAGADYIVAVEGFDPVKVAGHRVHRSENGKSYICTQSGEPPTDQNVLCVFTAKPAYV